MCLFPERLLYSIRHKEPQIVPVFKNFFKIIDISADMITHIAAELSSFLSKGSKYTANLPKKEKEHRI